MGAKGGKKGGEGFLGGGGGKGEEEAVAPDVGMWRCDEVSTAYDVSCSHPPPVYSPLSTLPDANVGAAPRAVPPLEMQTSVGEGCWGRVTERGGGGARIGEAGGGRSGGSRGVRSADC